jgi:hypothetical protein
MEDIQTGIDRSTDKIELLTSNLVDFLVATKRIPRNINHFELISIIQPHIEAIVDNMHNIVKYTKFKSIDIGDDIDIFNDIDKIRDLSIEFMRKIQIIYMKIQTIHNSNVINFINNQFFNNLGIIKKEIKKLKNDFNNDATEFLKFFKTFKDNYHNYDELKSNLKTYFNLILFSLSNIYDAIKNIQTIFKKDFYDNTTIGKMKQLTETFKYRHQDAFKFLNSVMMFRAGGSVSERNDNYINYKYKGKIYRRKIRYEMNKNKKKTYIIINKQKIYFSK